MVVDDVDDLLVVYVVDGRYFYVHRAQVAAWSAQLQNESLNYVRGSLYSSVWRHVLVMFLLLGCGVFGFVVVPICFVCSNV